MNIRIPSIKSQCDYIEQHSQPSVIIIIFGLTSCKAISSVLNRLNVNFEIILPHETPKYLPTHVILSGGPKHVYTSDHYPIPQWVLDSNCSVLGICYGMQLIAKTFGGLVMRMPRLEKGSVEVTEVNWIENTFIQSTKIRWMNRYDQVVSLPDMFHITAVTNRNHIAAFTDYKKWWAVQYHPESSKYEDINLFRQFLKI